LLKCVKFKKELSTQNENVPSKTKMKMSSLLQKSFLNMGYDNADNAGAV